MMEQYLSCEQRPQAERLFELMGKADAVTQRIFLSFMEGYITGRAAGVAHHDARTHSAQRREARGGKR